MIFVRIPKSQKFKRVARVIRAVTRIKNARRPRNSGGFNASITRSVAPVAYGTSVKYGRPLTKGGQSVLTVAHTELLSPFSIPVSYAFTSQSYFINPKMDIFPWLSGIATRFERYKFQRLEFEYVPTLATTVSGNIALAFDSDSNDPPPPDYTTMCSMHDCVSGNAYMPLKLVVDLAMDDKYPPRLCSTSTNGTDLTNLHLGVFTMAANGVPLYLNMSCFKCSYVVKFFTPEIGSPPSGCYESIITYSAGTASALPTSPNLEKSTLITTGRDGYSLPVTSTNAVSNCWRFLNDWAGFITVNLYDTAGQLSLLALDPLTTAIVSDITSIVSAGGSKSMIKMFVTADRNAVFNIVQTTVASILTKGCEIIFDAITGA